jgi:hypothetical protein
MKNADFRRKYCSSDYNRLIGIVDETAQMHLSRHAYIEKKMKNDAFTYSAQK